RFNQWFETMLDAYERIVGFLLKQPAAVLLGFSAIFLSSLLIYPLIGVAFFPRTDAGQFTVNVKAPSGTRLEVTEQEIMKVEAVIREVVAPADLGMIVSNIGVTPDFAAIYTSNSAPHTAFVQASLTEGHRVGSYEYMNRLRQRIQSDLPHLSTYFQSGGLVDAVLNLGLPAPIDIQLSGLDLHANYETALRITERIRH